VSADIPHNLPPEQAQIAVQMRLNASELLEVSVTVANQSPYIAQLILDSRA
jgi:hypothetical protein